MATHLDLTDEEAFALLNLLTETIERDRYPFSPRIRTLRGILAKFGPMAPPPPPPARRPTPEERDPSRAPGRGHGGLGDLGDWCPQQLRRLDLQYCGELGDNLQPRIAREMWKSLQVRHRLAQNFCNLWMVGCRSDLFWRLPISVSQGEIGPIDNE